MLILKILLILLILLIMFAETLQQIANDTPLRTSRLYLLSKMDTACWKIFETTWPTIATQRRQEIMQALVELSEVNFEVYFTPVFKLGLSDPDPQVRATSINGLWEEKNLALMSRFVDLLRHDESPVVRAAAAIALGRFVYWGEVEEIDSAKTKPATAILCQKIHQPDEDLEVRRRAVESIAYSSEDGVTKIIETAYYDEAEAMQASAVFAMGRSADNRWVARVMAELDNPSPIIRFEAARACGELEITKAVKKLAELIEDESDLEIQEMSIWALGHIGGQAARQILEHYLDHKIEALATATAEALEDLNLFGDSFPIFDFDEADDLGADDEDEHEF